MYSNILFYTIHFYFITSFEVFFYLYYIFPYEQNLLVELFKFNQNQLMLKYNITITDQSSTDLYKTENCRDDARRIDDANAPLFQYCLYYMIAINACLIFLFFYDAYRVYNKHRATEPGQTSAMPSPKNVITNGLTKNTFSFSSVDQEPSSVELVKVETNLVKVETESNETKDIEANIDADTVADTDSAMTIFKRESLFIPEFVRSVYFICFIGVFEYLFFTQIVDNIKVFDLKMILCNLLTKA